MSQQRLYVNFLETLVFTDKDVVGHIFKAGGYFESKVERV